MKKFVLITILALIAAVSIAKGSASGVTFTLTNVGNTTLESVIVEVTGRSYKIGDLAPGSSKSLEVNPTGESHIELVFSGTRRLRIDCYFESDYGGKITAEVTQEEVVSVSDGVQLPWFF